MYILCIEMKNPIIEAKKVESYLDNKTLVENFKWPQRIFHQICNL